MPKYYCDYCDAFLVTPFKNHRTWGQHLRQDGHTFQTHDSPSVRKTHNSGRKHKENVRMYYQGWMEQQAQKLVDATAKAFTQQRMMNPGSMPMMGPRGMMPPMPMGMRPGMPPGMPGMPPFPYPMMPPMMMGMPGMPPGMPTGVPPMPAGAMPPMIPQSIPMPTMPQLPQQQPKTEL